MNFSAHIYSVKAREILDSRGNPTVEATVTLHNGARGTAAVPSGASTGIYEAHELRDGNSDRYMGKGVLSAVTNINTTIASALKGHTINQQKIDKTLREADGSKNKSALGANALLAVSLASAKAAAAYYKLPLYRYIGGINACRLPVPMMNILNGGAHASNNIDIQEFMIMPVEFPSFSEALRAGTEIYHTLGKLLKENGYSTAVGDEGGFAPNLTSDEDAIGLICQAIEQAGYKDSVMLALDAAASEWYTGENKYRLPKRGIDYDAQSLTEYWMNLCDKYPIISIEDGLGECDLSGWTHMTDKFQNRDSSKDFVTLVGDDLFVTNTAKLLEGIDHDAANAILIKPNQIGTLSETLDVIRTAQKSGYRTIISHRSGETEDTTISDISVAVNAGYIKTGAPNRSERVSKYNRLLKIESEVEGEF